jgi:hypothetical protein
LIREFDILYLQCYSSIEFWLHVRS